MAAKQGGAGRPSRHAVLAAIHEALELRWCNPSAGRTWGMSAPRRSPSATPAADPELAGTRTVKTGTGGSRVDGYSSLPACLESFNRGIIALSERKSDPFENKIMDFAAL